MQWKIINARGFSYESVGLDSCINNALAFATDAQEKQYYNWWGASGSVLQVGFEDEENPETQYYAVGWYYQDERYDRVQFHEVCRIVKVEQELV